MPYQRRIIDDELDELLAGLAAIAIEGPKAVGKTATALQRAKTVFRLDDKAQASLAKAEPSHLMRGTTPILIDEWQRVPEIWDTVRRAVDEDPSANRFLITGSATPVSPPTHSGAGRIVRLRLRPLSLAERNLESPSVSLRDLLSGERLAVEGQTAVQLSEYAEEILASGFPAIRPLPPRARRAQLASYISRIIDRDFEEMEQPVRKPESLRRWLAAYAAATSTTASLEAIRDAATGGENDKPARTTVTTYRDTLQKLWILDPVLAWIPNQNYFSRLAHPDKRHLADPALAATLLGIREEALLTSPLLGRLFESLVTQSVRAYAQAAEAEVKHLRTKGGRQEVDLIIERPDGRVLAMEIKVGRAVADDELRHLHWLKEKLGPDLLDAMVITTGPNAYRRKDGIAVIPAALLGP